MSKSGLLKTGPGKSLLLSAVALCLATAAAHEHHGENIPEGEAVSVDPIVRTYEPAWPFWLLTTRPGLDPLDTHPRPDHSMGRRLPDRHGTGHRTQ